MLKETARYGLLSVVAISGLLITLRMLVGPFDIPIRVRGPLNPEGCFGLALTILLLTRQSASRPGQQQQERRYGWANAVAISALIGMTLTAFWRTLHFYFLSDDFRLVKLAHEFQFAFRPAFVTTGGDGFFRPIGYISLALTAFWAGFDPQLWHAASLGLHIANSILVFFLAFRVCSSRLAAFFAAALFAVHGTRPEAAVWIAGRFDLLATLFVVGGLLLFMRCYDARDAASLLYELASLLFMVLAVLSKESGYVFPALVLLFLISKDDFSRTQLFRLMRFWVLAATLFAYRWWLCGGIGGYRDPRTGAPEALTLRFIPILKTLALRLWATLFFPINWSKEPEKVLAVLTLTYVACLLRLTTARQRWPEIVLPLGFVLASSIPPIQQLLIGQDLQKSRLLYLPSVGFCLMLGSTIDSLKCPTRWLLAAVVFAFNLFALQHNLDLWEETSTTAKTAIDAAARCISPATTKLVLCGLSRSIHGVYLFANAFPSCLEIHPNSRRITAEFQTGVRSCGVDEGTRVMVWDAAHETLQCVEQRH